MSSSGDVVEEDTEVHKHPNPTSSHEDCDRLNPCSSEFDPLAALHCAHAPVGLPDVKPLANIKQFEEFQSDPEAFRRQQEEQRRRNEWKQAAKQKTAETTVPSEDLKQKPRKNLLTRMDRIEGPTSCLRTWMQKKIRVNVITRSFRSVRGTCSGFIVAFDKYLNLAMVDVDEVYTSLWRNPDKPARKRGSERSQTEKPTTAAADIDAEVAMLTRRVQAIQVIPCENIKRRHVNQLFIRGDNVVSISAMPL